MKKAFTLLLLLMLIFTLSTAVYAEGFDAKFDPREDGKVSSIKDQTPFGTCWAFAGLSTLESHLIKSGISNVDFSAEALIWWACGQYNITGFGWANSSKNDGGYSSMVTGYFMSGKGPVSEELLPYNTDESTEWYLEEYFPEAAKNPKAEYRVTDILYIDTSDEAKLMDNIKDAISKYGAVYTTWLDTEHREDNGEAYWTKTSDIASHAFSVIGWDDNYPKENFLPIDGSLPNDNGAWLIKNSYGKEFGDNGYIWISYEDESIFKIDETFAVMNAEKPGNEKILELDEYGAIDTYQGENLYCANVFDFSEGNDYLSQVIVMHKAAGSNYILQYAPLDSDGRPDMSKAEELKKGSLNHNGYETITLDEPYKLPGGKGAVLIKIDGMGEIGIDMNQLSDSNRPVFNAKINKGESFIINGENIVDVSTAGTDTNQMNFSIKAVTSDSAEPTKEPTKDTQQSTASPSPTNPVDEDKTTPILIAAGVLLVGIIIVSVIVARRKR